MLGGAPEEFTMESSSFPVTREKAKMVLLPLVNMTGVKEVQVFGSIARNGKGHDLDIVLIVDTLPYATFLTEMWQRCGVDGTLADDYYVDYQEERFQAAMAALSPKPAERGWLELAVQQLGAPIDLHLMPMNWQQHVDEVQQHLPHHDPEFVRNIARDVCRVEVWSEGPDEMIEVIGL